MTAKAFVAAILATSSIEQASVQPPQPTIQQQFDAASAALLAERWEEALRLFEAAEARLHGNRRTLAVIRVRKATALMHLDRREEAAAALAAGLPDLPADDRTLAEDRYFGLVALGEIAELALDYREARRHYRAAKNVGVPMPLGLTVYRGLIQTEMFEDAPAALAHADEALALARSAETGRDHEGLLRTLRGRVLLNMGRTAEARAELRTALQRLGGLTTRVNLADIVARSDLAIAAMLAGDEADARRYLAFTGAGHHETRFSPLTGAMEPLRCGDGIEPADRAVIEFSIRDDGNVGHATPVYSSRQGDAATRFAEAARRWAWEPGSFADIPQLFRAAMRVEMRCTVQSPDTPDYFYDGDEVSAWSRRRGIPSREETLALPLPTSTSLRQRLAQLESTHGAQSAELLSVLIALIRHPAVDSAETAAYLRRALPIAIADGAPPAVIAWAVLRLSRAEHSARGRNGPPDYSDALSHPAVVANPRTLAAVRLGKANSLLQDRREAEAESLMRQILASGLPADDPAIRGAHVLRAALAASRGHVDEARSAYEAAGPVTDTCVFVSRTPRPATSSRDFPDDAMRWGFEGWAQAEGPLSADGSVGRARTTLSYPPFVFDESAERVIARVRLEPLYMAANPVCGAFRSVVHFRIRQ